MTPLRIVTVDDEPLALDRLEALLARMPEVELVGRAEGCSQGASIIDRLRPDLALLDVQMRDGDAFDLLGSVTIEAMPMIAFTTAFPRYAHKAFRVDAIDYLLKPVEPLQLKALVDRALHRRAMNTVEERAIELQRVVEQLREQDQQDEQTGWIDQIWIRQRGVDRVRVATADIDYVSVQDDYACVHARGREHLLRVSLDRLHETLNPQMFVRIHRGYIVKADQVVKVRLKNVGVREAVLTDGTVLPIGRVFAKRLPWR
jgi:two-component system, LytTR family, response regulator